MIPWPPLEIGWMMVFHATSPLAFPSSFLDHRKHLINLRQAGFRKGFTTLDHTLTLRALIEEGRHHKQKIYCCFVDFRKAFDTVPRARLMQRLQALGIPMEIQWGIYALYESVSGRVRTPNGLSESTRSTVGVKQGCPLSPTLFGLYIDEISEYIERWGGSGAGLAGVTIPILLYADDIVLISDSPEGLQRHLNALKLFCTDKDLSVNLNKTKVMVFNTTQAWVTRAEPEFFFGDEKVAYTRSYTYLGVTFTGPRLSLHEAACARLSRGYAALGTLERQCAHIQFQEPRTKLWLFDTLVAPTLLYGVEIWGPSSYKGHKWTDLERPLVLMIGRMIRSKASVPHDIVRAEMGAAPIAVEALLRSVTNIQRIWKLPKERYPRLALMSSLQLTAHGDTHCWYAEMQEWFLSHGMNINALPPFQYSLDCPHLNMTKTEKNRVIRADIIKLNNERTWTSPTTPLGRKMAQYKALFLHISQDGFILRPSYMDTHLSHALRTVIGQLRTSSHQLEIEKGRYAGKPMAERICQLCHREVESEEHYVCHCSVFYEIRGRYHCLFQNGFGPLPTIMEYKDQRCLGLFLLELKRHREKLLKVDNTATTTHQQRTITNFFTPMTLPHDTIQPGNIHAPRVQTKGVSIDQAIGMCRARRPRAKGPRPRHPCHRQIKAIITKQPKTPPSSWRSLYPRTAHVGDFPKTKASITLST